MKRNDLTVILAVCLESIERGEHTLEECLALYPEHRNELEPLLRTTALIRERADFTPRASFRLARRARLLRRLVPRQPARSPTPIRHARQRVQPVFSNRLAVLWTTILVLAGSLVTAGTVYASKAALPGDVLYPVKLSIEDARLWFSDDAEDVLLATHFVQVRMEEIQALIDSSREEDLDVAVNQLSERIVASTESLAAVARDDPERAAQLSFLLEEEFSAHTEVLTSQLGTVPAQAKPAIENAINASNKGRENVQRVLGNEIPGGGPPEEIPGPASTQPGGGPPEEMQGPASTEPAGGPPDKVPGSPSTQPGGSSPGGEAGPPTGVPGNRP